MNEQKQRPETQAWWVTYLRAIAFAAPSVAVLWFCVVFLFPKLREMWLNAGFAEPLFINMFAAMLWVLQAGLWLGPLLLAGLVLLEWRSKFWARHRKGLLEFTALALNAVILVLVTTMFTSALIVAPTLPHH